MSNFVKLLSVAVLASCTTEVDADTQLCKDAEAQFASCGLAAPAGFGDSCVSAPAGGQEVIDSSCGDLTLALDALGKADFIGFDRAEGEPCVFNVQCDSVEALTCRPNPEASLDDHVCLYFGRESETCDDASDCVRGDPCYMGACAIHDRGGH